MERQCDYPRPIYNQTDGAMNINMSHHLRGNERTFIADN